MWTISVGDSISSWLLLTHQCEPEDSIKDEFLDYLRGC